MFRAILIIMIAIPLILLGFFIFGSAYVLSSAPKKTVPPPVNTPPPPVFSPTTPPPVNTPVSPPPVIQQPVSLCNKTACNNAMNDWIVNKYWAFDDTAKNFGDCKSCDSRWFRAPMDVSWDGNNYKSFATREDAYNYAQLK